MTRAQEWADKDSGRWQLPQLDLRTPIEPRPQGCAVPLTSEQRFLLRAYTHANPEQRPLSVRMCASATRITGALSLALLERSIAGLMRRHESLRTTFKRFAGVTTQHIAPPAEYRLPCVDLSALSKSEADAEALRLTREFQDEEVDLSIGPVFEARLFKIATQEHVLIVLADHLISDGMSNAVLDKEIWQAYDDAQGDEPASLPTPLVQFADYAVWRERTRESWRTEHEDYWRQRLAGAAPTIIPVSSGTHEYADAGSVAHIPFGRARTTQLRQLAERHQVSLSNVMLMIYATAMSLWCDKEDLTIRFPVHGHHRPELENVIGCLCNCLYLRVQVSRRATLEGLLALARDEVRNALAHRDFGRVLDFMPECLQTEVEFHWRSARWRERGQRGPNSNQLIKRQPFFIRSPTWRLNFWCVFNETPADICVTVRYRPPALLHEKCYRAESLPHVKCYR